MNKLPDGGHVWGACGLQALSAYRECLGCGLILDAKHGQFSQNLGTFSLFSLPVTALNSCNKPHKKKRVGVDVDGVLADLLRPILEMLNQRYSLKLTPEEIKIWDIVGHVTPKEDVDEIWNIFGAPDYIHSRLQPYPEAVEGMKLLAEIADIYIVTSQPLSGKTWTREREDWLYRIFGIIHDKVIHAHHKHVAFNGVALIDDKSTNIAKWQQEYPERAGILWDAPYNQDITPKHRTRSWEEVFRIVSSL